MDAGRPRFEDDGEVADDQGAVIARPASMPGVWRPAGRPVIDAAAEAERHQSTAPSGLLWNTDAGLM
jgi:hypothetical protein